VSKITCRDFRKIFKGKIVSVRDNNQFYSLEQELEIADREVEKITNDEDGVYVLLVKDDSIRVDEALIEFCNYKVTEYTVYDGCLIITVKPM
jgi:hypothetical protein